MHTFKRRFVVPVVCALMLAGGMLVALALHSARSASGATTASVSTGTAPTLTSVTPYQLSMENVSLLAPSVVPSQISASDADSVASGVFGDQILETVAADCQMEGRIPTTVIPCWVVSMTPPTTTTLRGPDPTYNDSQTPAKFTFEVVPVNRSDGSFIEGYQAGWPSSATAAPSGSATTGG